MCNSQHIIHFKNEVPNVAYLLDLLEQNWILGLRKCIFRNGPKLFEMAAKRGVAMGAAYDKNIYNFQIVSLFDTPEHSRHCATFQPPKTKTVAT